MARRPGPPAMHFERSLIWSLVANGFEGEGLHWRRSDYEVIVRRPPSGEGVAIIAHGTPLRQENASIDIAGDGRSVQRVVQTILRLGHGETARVVARFPSAQAELAACLKRAFPDSSPTTVVSFEPRVGADCRLRSAHGDLHISLDFASPGLRPALMMVGAVGVEAFSFDPLGWSVDPVEHMRNHATVKAWLAQRKLDEASDLHAADRAARPDTQQ